MLVPYLLVILIHVSKKKTSNIFGIELMTIVHSFEFTALCFDFIPCQIVVHGAWCSLQDFVHAFDTAGQSRIFPFVIVLFLGMTIRSIIVYGA